MTRKAIVRRLQEGQALCPVYRGVTTQGRPPELEAREILTGLNPPSGAYLVEVPADESSGHRAFFFRVECTAISIHGGLG